ncbi:MAG TPA: hypothetical protein PKC30_17080 [Saprospiraceae bacterium]|nr:hypothetical protein [Saprospiraceae bacterium]
MMTILLLCGIYNAGFALFHILFWKIFKWDRELSKMGFANKAIMQILNNQMIYYFIFVSFVCFLLPSELLNTRLGHVFLTGNSIFWLLRAIQQLIFLRRNHLIIHLLTCIFLAGAVLFIIPVL